MVAIDVQRHAGASAVGAALVGFLSVGALFGDDEGPVLCLFRRCTGGYCPGCGGSRAALSLVRGDVGAAWAANPWAVLVVVQAVVAGLVVAAGQRARLQAWLVPVLIANLVLGVGIWILRLATGAIPIPFA